MLGSKWMRPAAFAGIAAVIAVIVCAKAWAWPWEKKITRTGMEVKLVDVMRSPNAFLRREVTFECRFALQGKLFKHFNTRFNEGEHANFAVWAPETKLWDKRERRNVLPTLYVDKSDKELFRNLRTMKRYQKIRIVGEVVSAYAGLPWLMIRGVEVIDEGENAVTENAIVHVRRGLKLIADGKHKLAAKNFEIALQAGTPEEQRAFVRRELGTCYVETGEIDKAIELFEEVVKDNAEDAEAWMELARMYLKKGDAETALKYGQKTVELTSDYPEAHAIIGEAYGQLGNTREALAQIELAENDPDINAKDRAMAAVHRARILVSAKKYADAVRAYAIAISGETELAGVAWLRKEIGNLYEDRFDETANIRLLDDAEREYANANVLSDNSDAEGLYFAARAAFKRAKSQKEAFGKANKLIEDALKADAMYVPAKLLQGEIALIDGNTEAAEKVFAEVAEMAGGSVDALVGLAANYEKMGKDDKALGVYAKAVELDQQNVIALEKHAKLSEKSGKLEDAKGSYAALVKADPAEPRYHWQLAKTCMALEDYETAAAEFGLAAMEPSSFGEDSGVMQAEALVLKGDYTQAEAVLRVVLKRNSGKTAAKSALAKILADLSRRPSEALKLATEASAEMGGKDAGLLDILAWTQVRSGKYDEALKVIGGIPAAEMTRSAWYHKAVAQYFGKDYAGAKESIQNAVGEIKSGEVKVEAERLIENAKELMEMIDKASTAVDQEKENLAVASDAKDITAEIEAAKDAVIEDVVEEEATNKAKAKEVKQEAEKTGEMELIGNAGNLETPAAVAVAEKAEEVALPGADNVFIDIPGIIPDEDAREEFSSLTGSGDSTELHTNNVINLEEDKFDLAMEEAVNVIEDEPAKTPVVEEQVEELPASLPVIEEEVAESLITEDSVEIDVSVPAMPGAVTRSSKVERNAEPEISIDFSDTEDNSAPRKIAPPPVETQEKDSQNMPKSEVNELPDWAM